MNTLYIALLSILAAGWSWAEYKQYQTNKKVEELDESELVSRLEDAEQEIRGLYNQLDLLNDRIKDAQRELDSKQ